jgi:hypothetical protein
MCTEQKTLSTPQANTQEAAYKVDKMTFLVTPVHREESGRTIHELLLNLMVADG